MSGGNSGGKNKEVICRFYEKFFNEHHVDAEDQYVKEDYIQHNPGVLQGRQGLKDAFSEKFEQHSDFHLEIQMMIAEGDKVAVYLKNTAHDGSTRCRVVDLYWLEEGMLAEHWDVL